MAKVPGDLGHGRIFFGPARRQGPRTADLSETPAGTAWHGIEFLGHEASIGHEPM
jgi:hypothetical protein